MGEFFRGWRRKVGVVTLLMACVLMAGWIRSLTHFEGVSLPVERMPNHFFVSWDSSLVWLTENAGVTGPYPRFKSRSITGVDDRIFESPHFQWRWKYCGFGSGVGVDEIKVGNRIEQNTLTVVPYWSVTIPLTLITAFLLLSKPRQSTQKKTALPAANERA